MNMVRLDFATVCLHGHSRTIFVHAGRLEDKAAIVRKAALQLLGALMHSNPFAPVLAHAAFEASLQEYQAKLQVNLI